MKVMKKKCSLTAVLFFVMLCHMDECFCFGKGGHGDRR